MEMKKLLTLILAMLTLPLAARQYEVTQEYKGFDKIHLNPGEAKTVSVRLDEEAFRYYDPIDRRFVVEPGTFTVHVGASSADIRLTGKLEVPSGKY